MIAMKSLTNYNKSANTTSSELMPVQHLPDKLNEAVISLNKCKLEHFDRNYECYTALSYLMTVFQKNDHDSHLNSSFFKSLIGIFLNVVTEYSPSYKYFIKHEINTAIIYPANPHNKLGYEKLSQDIRRLIVCSYVIKILNTLAKSSNEIKNRAVELNGFEAMIGLLNNESFINSSNKHRCLEDCLLFLFELSSFHTFRLPLIQYADQLLRFNKAEDRTAFLRCRILRNLFLDTFEQFEEKINQKFIIYTRILKKNYQSQIRAEFNSIYFVYSILSMSVEKAHLVKLILDENCLHIFLNKINELSFVCHKFIYSDLNFQTDLLPIFDIDQNKNNVYRLVYYVYVFYQLISSNSEHYRKLLPKTRAKLHKSLEKFLTNRDFLRTFAQRSNRTVIDLEKCLFYCYIHNQSINEEFNINIFDIIYNIAFNYSTCSVESFLILSKIVNNDRMDKLVEKFSKTIFEYEEPTKILNKCDVYNNLFFLYFLIKIPRSFTLELTSLARVCFSNRFQELFYNLIVYSHSVESDFETYLLNANKKHINFEKYQFDANIEVRNVCIFYYLIYINWYLIEHVDLAQHLQAFKPSDQLNVFDRILQMQTFLVQPMLYHQLGKLVKSVSKIIVQNEAHSSAENQLEITANKFQNFVELLFCACNENSINGKLSKEQREERDVIIEDLLSILKSFVRLDSTLTQFTLDLIENCVNDHALSGEKLNKKRIKIFHINEKEPFMVYSNESLILTYALQILSDYLNAQQPQYCFNEFRIVKKLLLVENLSLIEKKYTVDLLQQLLLRDQMFIDLFRTDDLFLEKFIRSSTDLFSLYEQCVNDLEESNKSKTPTLFISSSDSTTLVQQVDSLSKSENYKVKSPLKGDLVKYTNDICKEILWLTLNCSSNSPRWLSSSDEIDIIICYNLYNQELCAKIRDILKKQEFRVHMEIYDVGTYNLNKLTSLLNDNSIVLLCLSEKYSKSVFAQLITKYAYIQDKVLIPFLADAHFDLKELSRVPFKLEKSLDFVKYSFDHAMQTLLDLINKFFLNSESFLTDYLDTNDCDELNKPNRSRPNIRSASKTLSPSVKSKMSRLKSGKFIDDSESIEYVEVVSFHPRHWDQTRVQQWFEKNQLSLNIFKCLISDSRTQCDGELLNQFYNMLVNDQNFFYSELIKKRSSLDEEFKFDADDMTKFRFQLKNLFERKPFY
jgi:hypothetical protein